MEPFFIVLLLCWFGWTYSYSRQLSNRYIKQLNFTINPNKILILSLVVTPIIFLTVHFSFLFIINQKGIALPDWLVGLINFSYLLLIPALTPKLIARILFKYKKS